MSDENWVALMSQSATPMGTAATTFIDPEQMDMLLVESELERAGIPCGFDPHRPGEASFTRGGNLPVRLMIPESQLAAAKAIRDELLGAG